MKMGRSLLKDMDIENLYSMRREGMSNIEIAKSLGVSKQTVYRLIGPQPKELTSRMCSEAKTGAKTIAPARTAEPEPEACLVVETRQIALAGTCFCYRIDTRDMQVAVISTERTQSIYVDVNKLGDFIKELSAIKRKMEGAKMTNEMW